MLNSITLRLTLLFAAVSTVVLLGLAYLFNGALERHFEEQDLTQMRSKLELGRELWSRMETPQDVEALAPRMKLALVGHPDISIVVASPEGKSLFATGDAEYPPELMKALKADPGNAVKWREGTRHFRGIAAAAASKLQFPSVTVAVLMDIGSHEQFMREFHRDLWLGLALSLLVAALLGWVAVRYGLGPVRRVAALAQGITVSRLTERLSTEAVPRELAELVNAFNAMLERLQDSFRRLSEFSSDVAHELRTPIAVLTTQTQVALSRVRSADEYREVLYSNLDVLERMARVAVDMLFLAKADSRLVVPSKEPVQLHTEIEGLFDFYAVLADEQRVRLALRGEATVNGDRPMIRRAIGNLLSNAIRHAPEGGNVEVSLHRAGDEEIQVHVRNTGDDIPSEHLPHLFERFYRVENPAGPKSEGTGLGLAITKAIVEAHGGKIGVRSEGGSVLFMMTFPAVQGQPANRSRRHQSH